jgi:hypothetical protein
MGLQSPHGQRPGHQKNGVQKMKTLIDNFNLFALVGLAAALSVLGLVSLQTPIATLCAILTGLTVFAVFTGLLLSDYFIEGGR